MPFTWVGGLHSDLLKHTVGTRPGVPNPLLTRGDLHYLVDVELAEANSGDPCRAHSNRNSLAHCYVLGDVYFCGCGRERERILAILKLHRLCGLKLLTLLGYKGPLVRCGGVLLHELWWRLLLCKRLSGGITAAVYSNRLGLRLGLTLVGDRVAGCSKDPQEGTVLLRSHHLTPSKPSNAI